MEDCLEERVGSEHRTLHPPGAMQGLSASAA